MKEQVNASIEWVKTQPVKGCITGSCLLDYFEGQDVDVFMYDEKSFTKLLFAMHYNNMFTITDPLDQWKFDQFVSKDESTFYKFGLVTIKFTYNTCVPVNIILKKKCVDIFSVLASFDLDIICVGYDIQSQQTLDLSQNLPDNQATWNKWNTSYYSSEIWEMNRVLRQLSRCFKYHERGYNTDLVVKKYIEIIDALIQFDNIFTSENFDEKLKITKENTLIVKQICEIWLETHEVTKEQIEILEKRVKQL